jgi:hypothetical protein
VFSIAASKPDGGSGMKVAKVIGFSLLLILFFFVLFPRPAYAYLDMGTGSYIFQMSVAAFFGVMVALRIYWDKVKTFVSSIFKRKKPGKDE